MKAMELASAIGNLDTKYIEEAAETVARRKRSGKVLKTLLISAAIVGLSCMAVFAEQLPQLTEQESEPTSELAGETELSAAEEAAALLESRLAENGLMPGCTEGVEVDPYGEISVRTAASVNSYFALPLPAELENIVRDFRVETGRRIFFTQTIPAPAGQNGQPTPKIDPNGGKVLTETEIAAAERLCEKLKKEIASSTFGKARPGYVEDVILNDDGRIALVISPVENPNLKKPIPEELQRLITLLASENDTPICYEQVIE